MPDLDGRNHSESIYKATKIRWFAFRFVNPEKRAWGAGRPLPTRVQGPQFSQGGFLMGSTVLPRNGVQRGSRVHSSLRVWGPGFA